MVDICLLGCGGMMPLKDRYLTALYARVKGRALLIDCGEGTQTAIRASDLRFKIIDDLLFTHYHADHVSGVPGLLLSLANAGREQPLNVYGPVGIRRVLSALCVIVPEAPFEIRVHEIDQCEHKFDAAGLNVTAFPVEHGMPCLGYALSLSRAGRFDAERARAAGVPVNLWNKLQKGERAGGFSPSDVLGAPRKGIKFVYATDTRPTQSIVKHGADADLMILEGMFGETEKLERALATRHMMMSEAARIASRARAKALWLTHFSPATPKPEEFLEDIKAIFPNTEMGFDGKKIVLNFEDNDLSNNA